MNKYNVFVYGTLKGSIAGDFMGTGIVLRPAKLWQVCRAFPGLKFDPIGYNVVGEVYQVTEDVLDVLDLMESHPRLYKRVLENVLLDSPELDVIPCWVYEYQPSIPDTVAEVGPVWHNS